MWYFAYASNMNRRQMEERLHRAGLRWMIGRLDGYRVRFNKKSDVDESGKANVVPADGETVWGVLYDLSEQEIEYLGSFEHGYRQKTVEVSSPGCNERLSARTFIADPAGPDLVPAAAYLRVIVEGARQHGLPADYCERLANLKTKD